MCPEFKYLFEQLFPTWKVYILAAILNQPNTRKKKKNEHSLIFFLVFILAIFTPYSWSFFGSLAENSVFISHLINHDSRFNQFKKINIYNNLMSLVIVDTKKKKTTLND